MAGNNANIQKRKIRSVNRRILRSTTFNILILVIICCTVMTFSMQSLAMNILLDSMQPMVRQSAKTVEANIHMLADRMMTIAGDPRMISSDSGTEEELSDNMEIRESRNEFLEEAARVYELYTIALYGLDGQLIQGIDGAPERVESNFLQLLQETDNLTINASTIFQNKLGITMGMPVKENGDTILYVVGVYKYDILNDVISSINLGKHGMAYMVNREGVVTGHPDLELALEGKTLMQLNSGNNEALSRVTTGETGATEFPIDGENMLVAFSPIRGTQWSLVLQVPKADYYPLINAALWVAVWFTLVVLILSILLVLRLARSISRPVKSVTSRMVMLSEGDLHTEVALVHSRDELEVLTQTLDDTVKSVNRYISDIQQVLTQVAEGNLGVESRVDYKGDFVLIQESLHTILQSMNETIGGFRGAAIRLVHMSEELSGQSGQLHQASVEQNQSAEALVQEVSHVKERLCGVTESSGQTRTKAEEIAWRVREANVQMASLSNAMGDISVNAQEITKIAKAIEDIAFQTSILALNASVEAARAGTAGKGFAVVADEVKQLASKSAEAAQSATEIVSSTRGIIQTGVDLTAVTADSLYAISAVSDQISTISDQLVEAVRSQESALIIMDDRIANILAIADRNLQNAGGMEQASGSLAEEAEVLQAKVRRFVLKGGRDQ